MCSVLSARTLTAARGATAVTVSRKATKRCRRWHGRTGVTGGVDTTGRDGGEHPRPPEAEEVATAWHGMETSSASGHRETSGAVGSPTNPSAVGGLGPGDGGSGLLDRKKRGQGTQQQADDARDDGDESG